MRVRKIGTGALSDMKFGDRLETIGIYLCIRCDCRSLKSVKITCSLIYICLLLPADERVELGLCNIVRLLVALKAQETISLLFAAGILEAATGVT